jgi:hypothetical protein
LSRAAVVWQTVTAAPLGARERRAGRAEVAVGLGDELVDLGHGDGG